MKTLLATFLLLATLHAQQPQQQPCQENVHRGCFPAPEPPPPPQPQPQPEEQRGPGGGKKTEIVFTWSYNYARVPVCTATVTTNCVHHFLLSEGKTAMVALAATTALSYNYILRPLPSRGTHNYNLVAVEVTTGDTTLLSPPVLAAVKCTNSQSCQTTTPTSTTKKWWE